LLLEHARRVSGRRVLIALDADEALSANALSSPEWQRVGEAAPGTVLRFRWVNVLPGFRKAWIPRDPIPCGFVDDGSGHAGERIHSRRIPWPKDAPVLDLDEVVVLHFQYAVWDRMVSKQRWYQAWEYISHREKGALQIFREYGHMYGGWDKGEIHPVRSEWLEGYRRLGIDYESLSSEPVTWWDKEVLEMLQQHGTRAFRKIDIWERDWNEVAAVTGITGFDFRDPRSTLERGAHRLLKATQAHRSRLTVRAFEQFLRSAGW
jgi:hypothetical protein